MLDLPGWTWQVLAGAACGLALGVLIGLWRRRRARAADSADAARRGEPAPATAPPGRADSPQQRLLERLREQNLQLTTQLRANADLHAKQFVDKNQEQLAEKLRHQREMEEARQKHSAELSYLMKVVLEQVDALQKAHGQHVRVLDAEIDRLKALAHARPQPAAAGARPETDTARRLEDAATEVHAVEFAATRALESLRDR